MRILGNGELTKKLTVVANGCTKSAAEKIKAAGGTVEIITKEVPAEEKSTDKADKKVKVAKDNPEVS